MRRQFRQPGSSPLPNREKASRGPEWPMPIPSATEAVVTFTARDADGQMLASVDKNLSPNGHAAQNMAPLFALSSFTGSLEVTSTAPIVSLSINAEAAPVFSSLPPGELDAAAQGSNTYYFPHLAVGQKWQTTITYINYSSQEVRCQTDFISDHGTPLMVSFAALGTVDQPNRRSCCQGDPFTRRPTWS